MKAKVAGNQWENLFERLCHRQGIAVTRIWDGCKRVAGFQKLIPMKQACDWIIAFNGKACLVDTKTQAKGQTFANQKLDINQIHKMGLMAEQGILAGYLVWARASNQVFFIPVDKLKLCLNVGSSVKFERDGKYLGPIEECNLKGIFE